jgi:hypothetical protein
MAEPLEARISKMPIVSPLIFQMETLADVRTTTRLKCGTWQTITLLQETQHILTTVLHLPQYWSCLVLSCAECPKAIRIFYDLEYCENLTFLHRLGSSSTGNYAYLC